MIAMHISGRNVARVPSRWAQWTQNRLPSRARHPFPGRRSPHSIQKLACAIAGASLRDAGIIVVPASGKVYEGLVSCSGDVYHQLQNNLRRLERKRLACIGMQRVTECSNRLRSSPLALSAEREQTNRTRTS